jgi:hypothetical protein
MAGAVLNGLTAKCGGTGVLSCLTHLGVTRLLH